MNIIFKLQASAEIGSGHLVRCINLAKSIREHLTDSKISFILNGDMEYVNQIKLHGFSSYICQKRSYNSVEDNAADTINIIRENDLDPNIIIIDDYSIGRDWENILYNFSDKIIVIDDLANREHSCDILIDQNIYSCQKEKYAELTDDNTKLLLGPKYAILHEDYGNLRNRITYKNNGNKKIMISFGGTDIDNATGLVLEELTTDAFYMDYIFNVVVTDNFMHKENLKKYQKFQNVFFHYNLPSLAALTFDSNLCIGACGSSIWERFALGTQSIVITIADNQVEIAKCLSRNNFIEYLGDQKDVFKSFKELYKEKLKNIFINFDNDLISSKKITNLVDCNGSKRIINEIKKLIVQ